MENYHTVEEENILKCCLCFSVSKLIILADNLKGLTEYLLSVNIQTSAENEQQLICSSCYKMVTDFRKFRKQIRKMQRHFHPERIQKNVQEGINDEPYQTKKNVLKRDSGESSHRETYDALQTRPSSVEKKCEKTFEESSSSTFICDLCPYHSCRPKDFSRHVRSHGHLTVKHRICSLCSHICDGVSDLLRHRKEVHADSPISYKCSVCDDSFATKHEIHTHKLRAHNIVRRRRFRCKACKRIFSSKIIREKHRCRSKSSEYTIYECSRCKKRLSCSATLKTHDELCAAQYKKAQVDKKVVRLEKTYLNENVVHPRNLGSDNDTRIDPVSEQNTVDQQQKPNCVYSEKNDLITPKTEKLSDDCNSEESGRRDLRNTSHIQSTRNKAVQEVEEAKSNGNFEVIPHNENLASTVRRPKGFISRKPRGGDSDSRNFRSYDRRQWSSPNCGYQPWRKGNMRPYHEPSYVHHNKFR